MCTSQYATISAITSFVIIALLFDAKVTAIAGPFYTSFTEGLPSNHKFTSVKLKATSLKFPPNRGWHGLTPAGGTFVSATGGTFQSDTPGTFVSAMGGTFDSDIPGTFESATGGTFNPLLSNRILSNGFPKFLNTKITH